MVCGIPSAEEQVYDPNQGLAPFTGAAKTLDINEPERLFSYPPLKVGNETVSKKLEPLLNCAVVATMRSETEREFVVRILNFIFIKLIRNYDLNSAIIQFEISQTLHNKF